MPYTVSCSPAPRRGFRRSAPKHHCHYQRLHVAVLLSLIRRERIEIYPDRMVWNKTYFGITRSNAAPLADVLGADWSEGEQKGRSKTPDHVELVVGQFES